MTYRAQAETTTLLLMFPALAICQTHFEAFLGPFHVSTPRLHANVEHTPLVDKCPSGGWNGVFLVRHRTTRRRLVSIPATAVASSSALSSSMLIRVYAFAASNAFGEDLQRDFSGQDLVYGSIAS